MEADKKKIAVIMPQGNARASLCSALAGEYAVIDRIPATWDNVAAVLVDLENEKEQGCLLVERLKGLSPFSAIPILGLVSVLPQEREAACVERGFFDIIQLPCPRALLLKRIGNAVRASDSLTFHEVERMLKELPSNIFLKDTEGRYVFATQYWHHMYHAGEPGWSVRGKTDLELRKNKENALKAMEADRKILRTGKGAHYIIEEKEDGTDEYLELIKRPVFDHDGKISGIIALINDVTEQQMLKKELEKRSETDPLTELLNKRMTESQIRRLLEQRDKGWERGALLMIDVDNFKSVNDSLGHAEGDHVLVEIARIIRRSFRVKDVAGRIGGDEFMVFLRNIADEDVAHRSSRRLEDRVRAAFRDIGGVTLSIGIALYPQHGNTFEELYQAADQALYQVKKNGKDAHRIYQPQD